VLPFRTSTLACSRQTFYQLSTCILRDNSVNASLQAGIYAGSGEVLALTSQQSESGPPEVTYGIQDDLCVPAKPVNIFDDHGSYAVPVESRQQPFELWSGVVWYGATHTLIAEYLPLPDSLPLNERLAMARRITTYYCRHEHNDWSAAWMKANLGTEAFSNYTGWLDGSRALVPKSSFRL
jgi:hypothetical protein